MKTTDEYPAPLPRDTRECREGRMAFIDGKDIDDNPYKQGHPKRTGWFVGWLDRRTEARLHRIFGENKVFSI